MSDVGGQLESEVMGMGVLHRPQLSGGGFNQSRSQNQSVSKVQLKVCECLTANEA